MRIATAVLLASLVVQPQPLVATGGWHTLGNVSGVKVLPNGLEVAAGAATVRVLALSSNVVRVRYAPDGQFPSSHQSFAVLPGAFPNPPAVNI